MLRLGAVAAFCTVVAVGLAHAEDRTIVVYFTEWSAQIDDLATGLIRQAAELSRHGGGGFVTVTGFADSTGTAEAAKLLSATRAQVVVDALVRDGVSSNRIQKAANGATDFVRSPTESHRVTIGIPPALTPIPPPRRAPGLSTDWIGHMAQHALAHDGPPSLRRLG